MGNESEKSEGWGGKRKRAGRPPAAPGIAREDKVVITCTPAQRARWGEQAKQAGLTASEWARRRLNS